MLIKACIYFASFQQKWVVFSKLRSMDKSKDAYRQKLKLIQKSY